MLRFSTPVQKHLKTQTKTVFYFDQFSEISKFSLWKCQAVANLIGNFLNMLSGSPTNTGKSWRRRFFVPYFFWGESGENVSSGYAFASWPFGNLCFFLLTSPVQKHRFFLKETWDDKTIRLEQYSKIACFFIKVFDDHHLGGGFKPFLTPYFGEMIHFD